MHLWFSQVQCNLRPRTEWALLWRMSQGRGLLTGCLDCQIGGISCQTNQSTDDLTRVEVYIPQLLSPACSQKLRGVSQAYGTMGSIMPYYLRLGLRSMLMVLCDSVVKNPPTKARVMQDRRVPSLGREDPLEEAMSTPSSILPWEIPWTEEPGGLQSRGSQRVGHNWMTGHAMQLLLLVQIAELNSTN